MVNHSIVHVDAMYSINKQKRFMDATCVRPSIKHPPRRGEAPEGKGNSK